jgi:hypothetical protein
MVLNHFNISPLRAQNGYGHSFVSSLSAGDIRMKHFKMAHTSDRSTENRRNRRRHFCKFWTQDLSILKLQGFKRTTDYIHAYFSNSALTSSHFMLCDLRSADHIGRAVWGMNCLRPLENWGRGFESHYRHGCLCAFILSLCCPVCR